MKKTIATYYGDPGTGISNKSASPYISEMSALVEKQQKRVVQACATGARQGTKPAIVLDADDTTLWTYDMEVADMHFNFNPAEQDVFFGGLPLFHVFGQTVAMNGAVSVGAAR